MKFTLSILLTLTVAGLAGLGYLIGTGWFNDPRVALRALKKQNIEPSFNTVVNPIGRDDTSVPNPRRH